MAFKQKLSAKTAVTFLKADIDTTRLATNLDNFVNNTVNVNNINIAMSMKKDTMDHEYRSFLTFIKAYGVLPSSGKSENLVEYGVDVNNKQFEMREVSIDIEYNKGYDYVERRISCKIASFSLRAFLLLWQGFQCLPQQIL